VLETVIVIALVATLAVLAVGIVVMLRGGEINRKYGNKLMRARVALQAIAVALVLALYMIDT
jgi:hypothetical protein